MSNKSLGLSESVHDYLLKVAREPALLARLRVETAALPESGMQISPEQGRFMAWLVGTLGVRRYLEVGVFTGYSSLSVALALPADGKIVACDMSREWTDVARRYWREAGVEDRIDLRLGPALPTLDELVSQGGRASFDLAFLDADKQGLPAYYERCLELLRPGGVIAVDNALWSGRVADPAVEDASTRAIRELNALAANDPRVSACLLPVGDGLLLVTRRA